MVTVGRILRPHGNRGEVVVLPESDFAEERFRAGASVYAVRGGVVEALEVAGSRPREGRWIVAFAGVGSISDAEALTGLEVRIAAEALQALGPGAYYVHDLVGCEVRRTDGRRVGVVSKVDLATGVPVLVVQGGGEVLVPFVDAICRRVAPGEKVIEIDPPDGLIDLNRTRVER
jgi:16S rRNA processing protein RimM